MLKVAHKAHPDLHAQLVDLRRYHPTLVVGGESAAPSELGFEEPIEEMDEVEQAQAMEQAKGALQEPLHLPAKSRFQRGPHVHIQFDGGSEEGRGTGGFVIIDATGREVLRAGRW